MSFLLQLFSRIFLHSKHDLRTLPAKNIIDDPDLFEELARSATQSLAFIFLVYLLFIIIFGALLIEAKPSKT